MHLGSRVPESDLASFTPKAQLFQALKQKACSEENFNSLLIKSGRHSVIAWGDANQPQEVGDKELLQSSSIMSPPFLQSNPSPESCGGIKRVTATAQPQMPKALLFDRLKQVPSALPPFRVADQLSDVQAVSQSADSSVMFTLSSIQSAAQQTESTETLSDTAAPLSICLSPKHEAEFIKNIPERLTVGHKGSSSTLQNYAKSPVVRLRRISPNKRYSVVICNESDVARGHHTKGQSSACSPFKSGDSPRVLGESEDFSAPVLAWTSSVPVSSSSQVEASDETNDNREMPYSSSGISLQNLLPSTEFLAPQNLACERESHSAGNRLFNRKTEQSVHCAAPLAVGEEVCSSGEDVCTQSSIDEVYESRPTLVKKTSNNNQSGENTDGTSNDQNLLKPKQSSKRLSLLQRKQESHLLSSKGDAAVIEYHLSSIEYHLSSTASELETGHQNIVELDKWTVRLLSDLRLCLTGYRKDEPGGRLHSSDPITRCLRRDMIQTVSGTLYRLSGRLCKSIATEAGLSKTFLHKFVDGFPPNWEDMLNKALEKISSRTPGSHSRVQKVLEEAKPVSDSAEDNRGTPEPVKKIKKVALRNDSSVAKILSNKGSKNDPLTLQDLPVARRSGRLVIPPLAWWANQRVIVDPTSKETIIAQENENVLGLPAIYFKLEKGIPAAELKEKLELAKTSSKEQYQHPQKSTVPIMKEVEVKSSSIDIIEDRRGTRPEAGRRKDENVSKGSVIESRQLSTSRQKKSDEASLPSRGSSRKREIYAKDCISCSTSSVDTACHSGQKRLRLDSKTYKANQSGCFSYKDCPQSLQAPQPTVHCTNNRSRKSLSINQTPCGTSDSAKNISWLSRSRRNCNVISDRNTTELHMQLGKKSKSTLTLHNSQVMRNSEKAPKQNSALQGHEEFLNRTEGERKDHECEGNEEAWGISVGPCSHKMIPRDSPGEKAGQRRSTKVHSVSQVYKEDCSKLSSLSQKSRPNSNSEEGGSARRESARKRIKKHRIKDLNSGEPVVLVYTKSNNVQKTIVMRHDSRKRRDCDMKDQPSFLIESPLLMQDLPPKPRPSRFQASGNLSDLSDSNDSANVEYFFSSDESET